MQLVGINLFGGGPAAFADVTGAGEAMLPKELAIADDDEAQGGQDKAFEFRLAGIFEGDGDMMGLQAVDGGIVAGIGQELGVTVMFLQQGDGATGLGGDEKDVKAAIAFIPQNLRDFSELVGVLARRRLPG